MRQIIAGMPARRTEAADARRTGVRTHPLLIRAVVALAAWSVAFLIVLALLVVFGAELESLPPALNALVFTGILVPIMGNLVMPTLSVAVTNALGRMGAGARPPDAAKHPQLDVLPEWPAQTIGVLATASDDSIYAIPISAPVRAADRRILLSLHHSRGSLARLRARTEVAVLVLAQGDIAMTARGYARVVEESMTCAPDYAAISVDVHDIDDHRQAAFAVESGVNRRWLDENERHALRDRVEALRGLATSSDG